MWIVSWQDNEDGTGGQSPLCHNTLEAAKAEAEDEAEETLKWLKVEDGWIAALTDVTYLVAEGER